MESMDSNAKLHSFFVFFYINKAQASKAGKIWPSYAKVSALHVVLSVMCGAFIEWEVYPGLCLDGNERVGLSTQY